jgi:N-acetylneuraminic acid mutarotase
MRRIFAFLVVVVLLTTLITAISLAQDNQITVDGRLLDPTNLPGALIDGIADETMTLNSPTDLLSLAAVAPSDSCKEAPDLILSPDLPADGVSFDTRDASSESDDPDLACMWGNPSRPQGYRTLWYRLVVPFSGRITLDTFSSGYDTVLGVFSGICGALEPVRCDDDSNGFSSATTFPVTAGEVYYIEIADWQPGVPNTRDAAQLNFSAYLDPVDSHWQEVDTNPTSPAISRHSTVAYDGKLYVIGGQSGGEGVPNVSNALLRLNVTNGNWKEMAQIPGAGYSNTTAALVNGRIYVPSGYNGNNLGYDNLHWVYDIAQDYWNTVASIPTWQLPGGKPFAWAASAVPPSNDRYYLMGGTSSTDLFDAQTVSNDETFVYVVGEDEWIWLENEPMQAARYAHTASWVPANNLGACVAGGLGVLSDGAFVFHSSAECYMPGLGWRWIGDMNIPRIGAGSAVAQDGKWYVFGGLTAADESTLVPVLQTEVYDWRTNKWSLLPPEFNLGGQDINTARAFTAGSMVGTSLYVTGGSIFFEGEKAINSTEKILLPSRSAYIPNLLSGYDDFLRPDDTFEEARGLTFGQTQSRNFQGQRDFYDFYTFVLDTATDVQIKLAVPDNNNFDLYLYGQNKLQWASSSNPFTGEDEYIPGENDFLRLEPRRYYVMVKREFPTAQPDKSDYYQITLRSQ